MASVEPIARPAAHGTPKSDNGGVPKAVTAVGRR